MHSSNSLVFLSAWYQSLTLNLFRKRQIFGEKSQEEPITAGDRIQAHFPASQLRPTPDLPIRGRSSGNRFPMRHLSVAMLFLTRRRVKYFPAKRILLQHRQPRTIIPSHLPPSSGACNNIFSKDFVSNNHVFLGFLPIFLDSFEIQSN